MKINLKSRKKIKPFLGFGASAAWWSPRVRTEKTAGELARILYGESGLKLNIYRYNAGGGFEAQNCRVANEWRRIESFMNPDGTFDYSRDKNAVRMMKKALETGNVDTLIFFANSPPFSHTVSGQASGGLTERFSNLPKENYQSFARYFLDIAEHFMQNGCPVKYISPINEPQWKWGGGYVWQEGCHYEPEEVRDCFHAFALELEKRCSPLLLYGPESGSITDRTKEYYELLSGDPLIMAHLGCFAYHSYGSDDHLQNKVNLGRWAQKTCKAPRFDMSEWCELPCKHATDDIESALIMARVMGEDIIYSGVDSWTAWVAANQRDNAVHEDGLCYSDGLIAASDDFSDYSITMRYWAMAHFSKFIPSGSFSLDLGYLPSRKLGIYSFEAPDGKMILIINNESRMKRVVEYGPSFHETAVFETTVEYQLKEIRENFQGKIHIKPKSLVTVILEESV